MQLCVANDKNVLAADMQPPDVAPHNLAPSMAPSSEVEADEKMEVDDDVSRSMISCDHHDHNNLRHNQDHVDDMSGQRRTGRNKSGQGRHRRVLLRGIDHVPQNIIAARLARLSPKFARGPLNLSKAKSGLGFILSHPNSNWLLNANIDDSMFGRQCRFTVEPVPDHPTTLFVRNIPSVFQNNDLLDALPGVYRIKRLPQRQSSAFVYIVSDEAAALLLRDGATICGTSMVFEVPKPHACRVCFSTSHRYCARKRLCSKCKSQSHLASECKSDIITCPYCEENHRLNECKSYSSWQEEAQKVEECRLLSLVPSLQDALEADHQPLPILTKRQQTLFEAGRTTSEKTYAEVVAASMKKRAKKQESKVNKSKTSRKVQTDSHAVPMKAQQKKPRSELSRPGPVETVLNALNFDSIHEDLVPVLKSQLSELLSASLNSWIEKMTNELQRTCDEFAIQEAKSVSRELSKTHAAHLGSGHWTIRCACGTEFMMADASEHQAVCSVEVRQSSVEVRKRSRTTDMPPQDAEIEIQYDEVKSIVEDVELSISTPSKKRSVHKNRPTPESIRQMKLTGMFEKMDPNVSTGSAHKPSSSQLAERQQ